MFQVLMHRNDKLQDLVDQPLVLLILYKLGLKSSLLLYK